MNTSQEKEHFSRKRTPLLSKYKQDFAGPRGIYLRIDLKPVKVYIFGSPTEAACLHDKFRSCHGFRFNCHTTQMVNQQTKLNSKIGMH